MNQVLNSIASVERETGIGKDTLRVWEKRYGFPIPARNARGERLYPAAQIEQLILVKRLLDKGIRPRKVVGLDCAALENMLVDEAVVVTASEPHIGVLFELIKTHQALSLRLALGRNLLERGIQLFLSTTVAPLSRLVGDAWMRGEIRIFEEHLYTEQMSAVLSAAISMGHDIKGSPRVLLTTLPGEEHALGLKMAEALLCAQGAGCLMLGVQTPITEIVSAVQAHHSDIVALTFSEAVAAQQVKAGLQQLRYALPDEVVLWVGGAGVMRQRDAINGVQFMETHADLIPAVTAWRKTQGVPAEKFISKQG